MTMMQAFQDWLDPEEKKRRERKQAYRESQRSPMEIGSSLESNMAAVQSAAAPHFAAQNDAISQINSAIANEMESRVNQAREARRMAYAQEMERIRQEGLLKRLQAEQEMQEKLLQLKKDSEGGVRRIRIDGRGNYSST
jgi:hypothetical protein